MVEGVAIVLLIHKLCQAKKSGTFFFCRMDNSLSSDIYYGIVDGMWMDGWMDGWKMINVPYGCMWSVGNTMERKSDTMIDKFSIPLIYIYIYIYILLVVICFK